jgi:hypothetical protein
MEVSSGAKPNRLQKLGIDTSAIPKSVLEKHDHFDAIWEGKVKDTIYLPKLQSISVIKRQAKERAHQAMLENKSDVKLDGVK